MFIVELESGVWLAPWPGSPGVTTREDYAKQWAKLRYARSALTTARTFRAAYPDAQIYETGKQCALGATLGGVMSERSSRK